MGKADKPLANAGKPAAVKSKPQPALRAIKGGKAVKPAPLPADDAPVIALDLPPVKLTPAMAAYFKKCQEKLGFVPNVLLAYAFDNAKLETFVALYNDLMLGESGLTKLEREMIAV